MSITVKKGTIVPIVDFDGNQLGEWDAEMINTIRDTVAPNASLTELALFGLTAKKAGLDPFLKEMWFVKYDPKSAGSIMTSYKGLLKTARSNPNYKSLDGEVVCENDDFEKITKESKTFINHSFNPLQDRGEIKGAWATAETKDGEITTIFVDFEEYCQYKKDKRTGKIKVDDDGKKVRTRFWREKPATMIKKVAKSHVIREAFGDYGMYTQEEMPDNFKLDTIHERKSLSKKSQQPDPAKPEKETPKEPDNVQEAEYTEKTTSESVVDSSDLQTPEQVYKRAVDRVKAKNFQINSKNVKFQAANLIRESGCDITEDFMAEVMKLAELQYKE